MKTTSNDSAPERTAATQVNAASASAVSAASASGAGSMTTKEEWQHFVNTEPPARSKMPSAQELAGWEPERIAAWGNERIRYHMALPPVDVPAMKRIRDDLMPLITSNPRKGPGAKRGGIIDGPGGVGKTTNITQLGRRYEKIMRGKFPNPRTQEGEEYIPVVYVTLPAETTIKGLNIALARFYGAVFSSRSTKDEIGYTVIDHARRCVTTLILVDDIHFLDMRSKDGRAINNHLKYLANSINATFVYAGIECEKSGLLNEGHSEYDTRFSQTRRRFGLHRIDPFSLDTGDSEKEWKTFLRTVENHLALTESFDGMLSEKLYGYIFDRTGGYIGAVAELVGRGAAVAIRSGEERITKKTLSGIKLDYAAEQENSRRTGKSRRSTGKSGKSGRISAFAAPRAVHADSPDSSGSPASPDPAKSA